MRGKRRMEVVALWSSLGVYLAFWTAAVVVEMRRVTRRQKGKKTMEPVRCCPNQTCRRYLVERISVYPTCECGWSLVEPYLEDVNSLKSSSSEEDEVDIPAAVALIKFKRRFGVDVDVDVAWYLLQLEQRYGVTVTATSNREASLPVVHRQSTPPPTSTHEDLDRAYVDLTRMKADLKRMEYVRYMRDVHGIFCSSSKDMKLP